MATARKKGDFADIHFPSRYRPSWGGLHHEPCDSCDSFSYSILQIKNRSKSIMWHFQGKVQGELCLHAPSFRTLILLETLGLRGGQDS